MKTLPRITDPPKDWTFDNLMNAILGVFGSEFPSHQPVMISYRTTVELVESGYGEPAAICVELWGTPIALMFPDSEIKLLVRSHNQTLTTQRRLNKVLEPIGYKVISRSKTWYVLDLATQETREYFDGIRISATK